MWRRFIFHACGLGLAVALAAGSADNVIISEFLASNSNGLADEDGDRPDWIELHNAATSAVNLDGWFLTDSAANLTKWRLPATNLPSAGFLVIFVSGKSRAEPGALLHASFQLAAGGEYLALVDPDGQTIISEYKPAFPQQLRDVSYGIGIDYELTQLLGSGDSCARLFLAIRA